MKKKVVIPIIVFLIFIIVIFICLILYKEEQVKQKKKAQARYSEIKENVKKAVEWNIRAQYPKCEISKEFKETNQGTYVNVKYFCRFLVKKIVGFW